MVANCKPAPDSVHMALGMLGSDKCPRERVLVVGDASFDIRMGKAAGVATCAVAWGAHSLEELSESRPDYLVSNVDELLRVILLAEVREHEQQVCPFHDLIAQ